MSETSAISTIPADIDRDLIDVFVTLIATVERTQRAENVDGFLDLFDEEAHWVNGAGRRLAGKPEIAKFTRSALPGAFATGSVDYVLRHLHVITSDVVLTGVSQTYLDHEGAPLSESAHGSPTYVWRRSVDGHWLIVAGQNTSVVEP